MPELLPILLVLTPLLGAIATLIPTFRAEIDGIRAGVALLMPLFAGLLVARIVATGGGPAIRHIALIDALSGVALLIVVPCGTLALLSSHPAAPPDAAVIPMPSHRYYAHLYAAICCLLLGCLGSNLALLWAGNALAILPLAGLCGSSGSREAREATAGYAACALVAAALALAGLVTLALAARGPLGDSFAALDWPALHRQAARLDPSLMRLTLVLSLGGFGALAGLIPCQGWLAKGQLHAPPPAQALAVAGSTGVSLIAMLRIYSIAAHTLGQDLPAHLLLALGLAAAIAAFPALWGARRPSGAAALATLAGSGMAAAAIAIGGADASAGALLALLGRPPAFALIVLVDRGTRAEPRARERMRRVYLISGLLALASGPLTLGAVGLYRSVGAAIERSVPAASALLLGAAGIAAALGRHALPLISDRCVASHESEQAQPDERGTHGEGASMLGPGLLAAALLILGIAPPTGLMSLAMQAAALL